MIENGNKGQEQSGKPGSRDGEPSGRWTKYGHLTPYIGLWLDRGFPSSWIVSRDESYEGVGGPVNTTQTIRVYDEIDYKDARDAAIREADRTGLSVAEMDDARQSEVIYEPAGRWVEIEEDDSVYWVSKHRTSNPG